MKYPTIKISKTINRNSIDIPDIDTEIHIDLNPCHVRNNNSDALNFVSRVQSISTSRIFPLFGTGCCQEV